MKSTIYSILIAIASLEGIKRQAFIIILAAIIFAFFYYYIPYRRLIRKIKKYGNSLSNVKKETRQRIKEMKAYVRSKGYRLFYITRNKSNINGNSFFKGLITIDGDWYKPAYQLNRREWIIAQWSTICHELGHKDNEPKGYNFAFTKDKIFVNYVREVRADLYAKRKLIYEFRYPTCDIMKAYALKCQDNKKDYSDGTHPSWNFRLAILEKYDWLNEEVIYLIADEVGLDHTNKAVVEMLDWYRQNDAKRVIQFN